MARACRFVKNIPQPAGNFRLRKIVRDDNSGQRRKFPLVKIDAEKLPAFALTLDANMTPEYVINQHPVTLCDAGAWAYQFYVVYQPVVRSETLQISGVEVLMRWRHPVAGEIPPDVFINLAETQQIIVPLTRHLLTLIAQDAPVLQTLLPAGSKLGINISPIHLHAGSFQQDLQRFTAAMPTDHFSVVLEITERAMIDKNRSLENFDWLHEQGFEIAIDDFGTGHSALIYLERYNFDYLKIDRGFVQAIGTETVTSPVLDAVITLSRRLKLTTVAEGVETQEQAEWLRDHGVNYLQGYWLSRPLTLEALIAAHDEPAKYFPTR